MELSIQVGSSSVVGWLLKTFLLFTPTLSFFPCRSNLELLDDHCTWVLGDGSDNRREAGPLPP